MNKLYNNQTGEVLNINSKEVEMICSVEEAKEKLLKLKTFIAQMMVEGVDYGILPKTDKKCLFKSGAEKLCAAYGLSPVCSLVSQVEDFDKGLFSYHIKVSLINRKTGCVESEGAGSCNSFESKYRKQDKYNLANTILKMAKKRAFVDAVLLATRSSDIFTQDIEDDVVNDMGNMNQNQTVAESTNNTNGNADVQMASAKQLSFIDTLLSQKKMPIKDSREYIQKRYGKNDSRELNKNEASDFIEFLRAS